jgi:signal transduction histidine kinase
MQQIEYGLIGKRVNAQRGAALLGEWALIVGGAIALALGILALASVERSVKDRETAHALLQQSEGDLRNSTLLLQVRNAQIEKATRLKSEFLANMSHELRTPLHTIIGFSEVLGEELQGPLNDKQSHCVNVIQKDALFLLQLINDILDLSRIEAESAAGTVRRRERVESGSDFDRVAQFGKSHSDRVACPACHDAPRGPGPIQTGDLQSSQQCR